MAVLVIADHDNSEIKGATLNAVTAAAQLGDVDVLVAGANCQAAADAAAAIQGVAKVRMADNAAYGNALAEPMSALIVSRRSRPVFLRRRGSDQIRTSRSDGCPYRGLGRARYAVGR